jgi:hypothetical protein
MILLQNPGFWPSARAVKMWKIWRWRLSGSSINP